MAEEKKKSRVDDINRSVYDIKDEVEFSYKADRGLTEDIIRKISAEKEEPAWMLEKRLQALRIYESLDVPPWAPDISELDMDHIDTYIRPKTDRRRGGKICLRISGIPLTASVFRKRKRNLLPA